MDRFINLSWLPFTEEPLSIEPTESQIQAANPALILILIPLFSYVIYPTLNRYFPLTALRKISIGFFITAAAFGLSALIESDVLDASSQLTIEATTGDGETEKKHVTLLSPRTEDGLTAEHDLSKLFSGPFAPGENVTYSIQDNPNESLFENVRIDQATGMLIANFHSNTVGTLPHISWQLLAYIILTSAEIMVSITALEFAYTQAPNAAKSIVMSMFLLTVFFGNLFTAGVNYFIQNKDGSSKLAGADYYWFFSAAMFVTALLFVVVAGKYRVRSYVQGEQTVDVIEHE